MVSRQRLWQIKNEQEGRCHYCSNIRDICQRARNNCLIRIYERNSGKTKCRKCGINGHNKRTCEKMHKLQEWRTKIETTV